MGERWVVATLTAAGTIMLVGLLWDVSWDASFGKDSFWSPPHLALNLGAAATAAIALLAIVLRIGPAPALAVGPMRAPIGLAVVVWGGLAMLAWAVVDDWWSRAYGLYADTWSPPQVLFLLALSALLGGVVLSAASLANRAPEPDAWRGPDAAAAWGIGLLLALAALATAQYNLPNVQRTATFLLASSIVFPALLGWAAAHRPGAWLATRAALSYTLLVCLLVWIFPLFPAEPLIGPIYEPVDHLLPPRFPLLLVVPALIADFLIARLGRRRLLAAVAVGASFAVSFAAVQWYFSAFLLAPASDNWFFAGGARHWPFYVQIGAERAYHWGVSGDPLTAGGVVVAAAAAAATAAAGIALGRWSSGVVR